MELYDVMRTTFAAREFTDDPLPDEDLHRILDNARFAPSGGNRQGWKVIIVRDAATRRQLADLCVPGIQRYTAQVRAGENPWNTVVSSAVSDQQIASTQVRWPLLDDIDKVPVLLVVCVDLAVVASFDSELSRIGVISGASIYPFVWNILLAARNEGYGGTITTFLTAQEPAAQALLGLPEQMAIAAMVPLGKPVKQLTRLRRKPVEEFAMWDCWGGEAFSCTS